MCKHVPVCVCVHVIVGKCLTVLLYVSIPVCVQLYHLENACQVAYPYFVKAYFYATVITQHYGMNTSCALVST